MRVVETRGQDIERRIVADRARDLAHHSVTRQPQLAHHLADGMHHLGQIVGWNDDQRDYQEQEYLENSQGSSVRRPPRPIALGRAV